MDRVKPPQPRCRGRPCSQPKLLLSQPAPCTSCRTPQQRAATFTTEATFISTNNNNKIRPPKLISWSTFLLRFWRGGAMCRVKPPWSRTVARQLEAFKMAWCNVGRPTTSERATYGVMWVDQSVTTGVDLVVRSREVDQCTPYSQHNNIHSLYCLQTYVTIAVKIVVHWCVYKAQHDTI